MRASQPTRARTTKATWRVRAMSKTSAVTDEEAQQHIGGAGRGPAAGVEPPREEPAKEAATEHGCKQWRHCSPGSSRSRRAIATAGGPSGMYNIDLSAVWAALPHSSRQRARLEQRQWRCCSAAHALGGAERQLQVWQRN
jgi:hypothetical protein